MKTFLFYISIILSLTTCQQNTANNASREGDIELADVKGNKFYLSDIPKFQFNGLSTEDSSTVLKKIINDWVNEEIFSIKAQEKITNLNAINVATENYKRGLISAAYEKQLLNNFELELTEQEVTDYYNNHVEFFVFEEPYYDINYILLPKETKNLAKIKQAITKGTENHWLDNYCAQEPEKCVIDKSIIEKETFLTEQLKLTNAKLKVNQFYNYQYISNALVMIYKINKEFKIGDVAPLEMVRTEVTKLALHKKKQDYLKEIKEKTIQKAKNDKNFEIHIN